VVTGELKEQNGLQGGYGAGRARTGTSFPQFLLLLCHFTLPVNKEGPPMLPVVPVSFLHNALFPPHGLIFQSKDRGSNLINEWCISTRLNGITSQTRLLFIVSTVRTNAAL